MQLFSEKFIKLWSGWEVRVLILLSLLLQIILVIFGSRRKFTTRIWTRILVWSAYLTADSVATVALGCLARSQADSEDDPSKDNNILQTFWAPFLLLHLGGPDTITAYSLEDNELWLRHFLGLIIQVGVAFYVFLRSWSNKALTYISIPMFVAGMIKYSERTFVLRSSSSQCFKHSLLSNPDPGPDFIEIQRVKTQQWRQPQEANYQLQNPRTAEILPRKSLRAGANDLEVAYFLFKRFRYLFADLILGYYERKDSYSEIIKKSAEDAFKLVAIELGLMYDVLYTKASIVYSQFGVLLRFITLCCSVSALVSFSIIIDIHSYSQIDISTTYVLLVGAVVLEIYAFIALFFSDWTELWFLKHKCHSSPVCGTCSCHAILSDRNRWSGKMSQYNLVNSCLRTSWIQKLPLIGELYKKYQYLTWENVNDDLQKIIFGQLLEKSKEIKIKSDDFNIEEIKIKGDDFNVESCKKLLAHRGDNVLQEKYGLLDQFRWSINDVEFDHSLLLWHIAIDLCYNSEDVNECDPKCRISKCLSEYMLYLLVFCPSMLPDGIGEIKYRDTYAEGVRFFLEEEKRFLCWTYVVRKKKYIKKNEACKALLGVQFGDAEERIKGDRSQSVLFYGCRLANQLRSCEKRWEIISEVLVEMLTYAANKCRWKEHGQHLRKGGELLTHVRVLMSHLGLSEQYRIQQPYYDQPHKHHVKVTCTFVCHILYMILRGFIPEKCHSLRRKCNNCCC